MHKYRHAYWWLSLSACAIHFTVDKLCYLWETTHIHQLATVWCGQALSIMCQRSPTADVLWHSVEPKSSDQMPSVFLESYWCRMCPLTSMSLRSVPSVFSASTPCSQCCSQNPLQHRQIRSRAESFPATWASLAGCRWPGLFQSMCPGVQVSTQHGTWIPVYTLATCVQRSGHCHLCSACRGELDFPRVNLAMYRGQSQEH